MFLAHASNTRQTRMWFLPPEAGDVFQRLVKHLSKAEEAMRLRQRSQLDHGVGHTFTVKAFCYIGKTE